MSGAFHTFSGLSNNNPVKFKSRSADQIIGAPCLYKDHYEPDRGFRFSSTGACVVCAEKPRFSLDLSKYRVEARRRAINFWSKVEIGDHDDCWKYHSVKKRPTLLHFWRRKALKGCYSFHPIRVAIWLAWGDFGNDGTVSLCGERRCCNPLHNLPASMDPAVAELLDKKSVIAEIQTLIQQLQQAELKKLLKAEKANNAELEQINERWGAQQGDNENKSLLSIQIEHALRQLKHNANFA